MLEREEDPRVAIEAELPEAEAGEEQPREGGRQLAGELRFALQPGVTPHGMVAAAAVIRGEWPGLRLQFRICENPLGIDSPEADVFFYFGTTAPPVPWRSEVFARCPQRLLASRDYLAARGMPRTVEELARHDLLVWHQPGERPSEVLRGLGARASLKAFLASNDAHVLHEVAHAGVGIAYVPDGGLPVADHQQPLARVLEGQVSREMQCRIAAAQHVAEIPKVRNFLDSLRAVASETLSAKPRAVRRG